MDWEIRTDAYTLVCIKWASQVTQVVKKKIHLPLREIQVRSLGWKIPWGEEMATQYSCLENPLDRGAQLSTVCVVEKSQTRLSMFTHV